jgi:hypothetical protein
MSMQNLAQNLGTNSPWTTVHIIVLVAACVMALAFLAKSWLHRNSKPLALLFTMASIGSGLMASALI